MKEEYWPIGAILLFHFGRIINNYYLKWKYRQVDKEIADINYDTYLDLREQTFALTPTDLGVMFPTNTETAFGIIMEMHTGTAIQSIVAFSTGEVWLYNSINPRKHVSDKENSSLTTTALAAITAAQYHYARMRRNNKGELLPGHIKFHILTNHDVYSADDPIDAFLDNSSQWEELFNNASAIIEEWNNISKSNPIKRVYPKFKINRTRPANL
ncbi:hypothetical protein DYU05_16860 [Mucilaginibacter terrenus]|uniref:Uncharacterized protein n=1 Tax=Mucilaginibacter terrenus TaxID=2482727 RepID=A0A3E2NMR2_9SPHI|nr:hypothetical protein [Mucilaginibacter terrenus]RFZ82284.1 hypothetical protein DYU05_16860 [Mucilaginibacter terrenus]